MTGSRSTSSLPRRSFSTSASTVSTGEVAESLACRLRAFAPECRRRMLNLYDIAYGLGLGLTAPGWLMLPKSRRKVLRALRERMGRVDAPADTSTPAVMIHAVSLGEINATRALVEKLR